ncbi:hypothetical protein [Streptomyces sp. NPDC101249]|uniref:hypothetical protein n=1 Tax=Streptomyces sp. NPDC101249 TaxID=3366140 RepID=UPI00381B00F5
MTACELCGNATSGYLCGRHRDDLVRRLSELPALYREVAECLVPRRAAFMDIIPTRSAPGPRAPINEDVLDTVNWGRATEVLRLWRTDVRRSRWPHRGAPPASTLEEDCSWLVGQMDWIVAAYPAAGDLAREVWDLNTQARNVVGDPEPRPQRLGTCMARGVDGTICGAVISRMPGQTRVQCKWCSYSYETERDWALLEYFNREDAA